MRGPATLLVLVDLIQDVDVLLPVLLSARAEPRLRLRVLLSSWLLKDAPRSGAVLEAHGIDFTPVRRRALIEGRTPALGGVSAVLTAAESSAAAHAAGHSLARRARTAGRPAYTVQHGVELADPGVPARMASSIVFCWSAWAAGQAETQGPTPVVVGRPTLSGAALAPAFDLGVFENLHWSRYGDAERAGFLDRLFGLLTARPGLRVRIRAHPAGGWLDAAGSRFGAFPDVRFEPSSESRASSESGRLAAASCARVLTTPSTVALDAVQAGRRAALALSGGSAYRWLPVLADLNDWLGFADGPSEPGPPEAAFLAEQIQPGNAAEAVVRRIISDLSTD